MPKHRPTLRAPVEQRPSPPMTPLPNAWATHRHEPCYDPSGQNPAKHEWDPPHLLQAQRLGVAMHTAMAPKRRAYRAAAELRPRGDGSRAGLAALGQCL